MSAATTPLGIPRQPERLLIVDADDLFARGFARAFAPPAWELVVVAPDRGLDVQALPTAAFLIDVCPGGVTRVDLVAQARRAAPAARILAVTSYPSVQLAVAVTKAGAEGCFAKPVSPIEILRFLENDTSEPEPTFQTLPSLAKIQWDYIARVLDTVGGNISLAARTLKIQRSTLQRKLKKYPPRW